MVKMEMRRRWILLLCSAAGIFLAMYASLTPKVSVRAIDFAARQKHSFGWSDRDDYLRQLPLQKYIEETTQKHRVLVDGERWKTFFASVSAASMDADSIESLASRVYVENRWSDPPFPVFFEPSESPLADIVSKLQSTPSESHYLMLEGVAGPQYLDARYHIYDSDDLGFGAGLSNPPPSSLLYPYRTIGFGIVGLGFAVYVLLPRKRRSPDTICYARWTIIPGDFVAMILFGAFFTLPLLLIGSSIHAITQAWPLLLVMWPIAFLGAWLLIHLGEYAAYEIQVREDGIEVTTPRGQIVYAFSEMESVQPLVLMTPDWLKNLTWLAALSGHGASNFRMAGQAMALGSSAAHGLRVGLKNGMAAFLWVPSGSSEHIYRNADRLTASLRDAGIPWKEDTKVVKALVRPDGEGPLKLASQRSQKRTLAALIVFPLSAMVIGFVVWWIVDAFDFAGHNSPDGASWEQQVAQVEAQEFPSSDVVWEHRYRAGATPMLHDHRMKSSGNAKQRGQNTQAAGICQLPDGALLIFGAAGQAMYQDGYVLKIAANGERIWECQLGVEGKSSEQFLAACLGPDSSILLVGTSGSRSAILGGRRAYVVNISPAGEKRWEMFWGDGPKFPEPGDARCMPDGSYRICGHFATDPSTTAFRLDVSATGEVVEEQLINVPESIGEADLKAVAATCDNGFVVTGDVVAPEQYKNLLVAKFDAAGSLLWTRDFGGPQLESGSRIAQASTGDVLAAGIVDKFNDSVQLYVTRMTDNGETIWSSCCGMDGVHTLLGMQPTADAGVVLVGEFRDDENSPSSLSIAKINSTGRIEYERHLTQPGVVYSGASAIVTSDNATLVVATRSWADFSRHAISLIRLAD
jgi:hypothetical protein